MTDLTPPVSSSPPPAPPPLPQPRRKRRGSGPWWLWLLLALSVLLHLRSLSSFSFARQRGHRERPDVDYQLAWGPHRAEHQVAILSLEGLILSEAPVTFFGSEKDPVTRLLDEIQAVTMDPNINAILLEVNSPGGSVTDSDVLYRALMNFRQSHPDRRILVHIRDVAASGAYYVSLPADQIIAQPTSLVGSIGVMISAINAHELANRIGISDVTLTSSENKALLSILEPVDDTHTRILQDVVDQLYHRFRDLVLEHRPFDADFAEQNSLLDGRVFTLPAAQNLGLVDGIGYPADARDRILQLLGVEEASFYEVRAARGGLAGLFSATLPDWMQLSSRSTRIMYLWKP